MSFILRGSTRLFLLLSVLSLNVHATEETAQAVERCEKAVTENVFRIRGKAAQDVQYLESRRIVLPGGGTGTAVKGEGRYRLAGRTVAFAYSCAYDADTGTTSGVVLRDPGGVRTAAPASVPPDISRVSPEACESAVATELKRKYPRVGRIAFGSESRRLRPGQNTLLVLEGQGAVERAAGLYSQPMSYSCEIDPRTGRVLRAATRE